MTHIELNTIRRQTILDCNRRSALFLVSMKDLDLVALRFFSVGDALTPFGCLKISNSFYL